MSKEYSFEMKSSPAAEILGLISYLGIAFQDLGLSYETSAKSVNYMFELEVQTDKEKVRGFNTLIKLIYEDLEEKTAQGFIDYLESIRDDLRNEG